MYILNVVGLREQLTRGPLPSSEVFLYLFVYYIIGGIVTFIPRSISIPSSEPGYIYVINYVIGCVGITYCYLCNGGKSGSHLLDRVVSLSLIMIVRIVTPFMIAINLAYIISVYILANSMSHVTAHEFEALGRAKVFAIQTIPSALLYWRVGWHIKFISGRSTQ